MKDNTKNRLNFGFIAITTAAFILAYIPILNIPFTWFTTFFHEISHGLMAVLTGGEVHSINLHLRGSGLCTSSGGIRFLVTFAGYPGAVFWGFLLYLMADEVSHKNTNILACMMAGLIAIVALLWGSGLITWGIMAFMLVVLLSIIKLQEATLMKTALKFIGIYVLLDAIRFPLYLIDGRHFGDGATMSNLTGLPEIVWVIIWLGIGVGGLLILWRLSKRPQNKET
jgi:hypothetical protein